MDQDWAVLPRLGQLGKLEVQIRLTGLEYGLLEHFTVRYSCKKRYRLSLAPEDK